MPMDRGTLNAHRAALELVRDAQQVDEELLPLLLPREIAPSVPMQLAVLQPHRGPTSPMTLARRAPARKRTRAHVAREPAPPGFDEALARVRA
jgi:hypothetical protein